MIYTVTLNPSLDYIVKGDSFEKGKTNRSTQDEVYPGGKGINVSIVLKQLGIESQTMGFVAGPTGEMLLNMLTKLDIESRFVRCGSGFTRINVKMKEKDAETEINGKGPDVSTDEFEEFLVLLEEMTEGDTLILSGSVPSSLPKDTYLQIMKRIGDRDVKCVIDTHGSQLMNVLSARPYLIKPNVDELEDVLGTSMKNEDDIVAGARRLKELGAKNVIVSRGEKGAILVDEKDNVHSIKCPPGQLVNSVGAGDSVVAGFIAGMMQNDEHGAALRLGVAAGCATAYSEWLATKDTIGSILESIE